MYGGMATISIIEIEILIAKKNKLVTTFIKVRPSKLKNTEMNVFQMQRLI